MERTGRDLRGAQGVRRGRGTTGLRAAATLAASAIAVLGDWSAWAWEEPEGFKGLKFGSPPAELGELTAKEGCRWTDILPTERHVTWAVYDCLAPPGVHGGGRGTWLGTTPIQSLFFAYLDRQLGRVSFAFESSDFPAMKRMFVARYGLPMRTESQEFTNAQGARFGSEELEWSGRNTRIRLVERGAYDAKIKSRSLQRGSGSMSTRAYDDWMLTESKRRKQEEAEQAKKELN